MTKIELLKYMKEKRREGYITHSIILDIFDDHDQIPEEVVELVCHKPYVSPPRGMIMGQELFKEYHKAVIKYLEQMMKDHLREETVHSINTNTN